MPSFRRLLLVIIAGAVAVVLAGCTSTGLDPLPAAAPSPIAPDPGAETPRDHRAEAELRVAWARLITAAEREAVEAQAEPDVTTAEECEAIVMSNDLSNAELRPMLRDLGCEAQADGLLVGSAEAGEDCIGYGCSAEQDALLNEQEAAANDDYGPGCNYQLCGSDLPENYVDPLEGADEGYPPTSGEEQFRYGCEQGYITEGC